MNKILVSGIELSTANEGEILNMGGPWIGEVSIGDDLISKDCIVDNFVYDKDRNLLFFVKFNKVSNHKWHFSISFYNIDTKIVFEFDKVFDMVRLGEFVSKNEIAIYPVFHDRFKNRQQIFNLDKEEFHQLTN